MPRVSLLADAATQVESLEAKLGATETPSTLQVSQRVAAPPFQTQTESIIAPAKPAPQEEFTTVQLPLVSEGWNGSDPANYVSLVRTCTSGEVLTATAYSVEVGETNTQFYVSVDTGSSLLWLQSTVGGGGPYVDQIAFTPSSGESTFLGTASDTEIVYGDKRKVQMRLYKERVNLGGLIASQQTLGAVNKTEMGTSMRKSRANGLMGLGTALNGATDASRRNLAQTLFAEGKIKFPSFSFVGPRNDPQAAREAIDEKMWQQPRGEFIIGALPAEVQSEEGIVWSPVQGKYPNRWVILLKEVLINGVSVCEDQWALIDSGTSYIITSKDNFDEVSKRLEGGPAHIDGKISSKLIAFPERNLTSIEFVFGTGKAKRSFPLTKEDLELGKDSKVLEVSSIVTIDDFSSSFDNNFWILGGIFMDNFAVTFDFTENKRRIGLATLRSSLDAPPSK